MRAPYLHRTLSESAFCAVPTQRAKVPHGGSHQLETRVRPSLIGSNAKLFDGVFQA